MSSTATICERPPSALSLVIRAKVDNGDVEAQCLCQRPPSALSQTIPPKIERRRGSVEAQCLCQRAPPAFSDVIALEIQFNQGCRQEACPQPASLLLSSVVPQSPRPPPWLWATHIRIWGAFPRRSSTTRSTNKRSHNRHRSPHGGCHRPGRALLRCHSPPVGSTIKLL